MPPQRSPRFPRVPPKTPNEIRAYRLRLNLTQRDVAALLGIRPSTVSTWERGLACPTGPALLGLAKALNTLAEALYPQFYRRREDATQVAARS